MNNLRHLLSFLAGELARAHGKDLFAQICAQLSETLMARGTMICRWNGDSDRPIASTLAFWYDGILQNDLSYDLTGTPCHEAADGKIVVYLRDLAKHFPDDEAIPMYHIESYIGVAFADSDGRPLGHIALFDDRERDFTQIQKDAVRLCAVRAGAEWQRLQSERSVELAREQAEAANRTKDQFLAALSHELRTPLTPVLMASTHLQSMTHLPNDAREAVDVIRRNVEMEARLIDDLLDLARITNGKMELHCTTTNLHDVIAATLQICWSDIIAHKLQIVQELDAAHPWTHADPARLQQVFWNLLKNAIKFSPPGSRITLRSRNVGTPAEINDDFPPCIEVDVCDTGIGMTPETIADLFNAFQQGGREITRQFGGLGLGLSICRAILEQHGASIKATSDGPGAGSTFSVALCTCATNQVSQPATPAADSPPQPSPTISILLVEDHQSTGQLLKGILERAGHRVTWAQSRSDALDTIHSRSDFDLLISDLGLPDGSGTDIMPRFRERTGRPGIALSGYGMDKDLARTKEAGFAMHLVKPIDIHRLRDAIGCLASR